MTSTPTSRAAAAVGRQTGARLLLGTTYAVIVSGALLLAVSEHTGVYLLVALALCVAHGLVVGPEGAAYVSEGVAKFLALGALGFGLLQARLSDIDLSYGLAHFLMLVQIITLYGERRPRDLRLIQVAALFETMVAGIWALDLVYLPAFALTGLCLMANLAVMAVLPASFFEPERPTSGPGGLTGWRPLLGALRVPALIVLGATILLFMLLPRGRERSRGMTILPEQVTGFSENVSLQEVGRLRQSDTVVLRAKFMAEDIVDRPSTKPPRMLLRGLSLPFYAEGQWFGYGSPRTLAAPAVPYRGADADVDFAAFDAYLLNDVSVRKKVIRQRIFLESNVSNRLFALYRPYELVTGGQYSHMVQPVSHHLRMDRHMEAGESYEVLSLVPMFTADQLRAAGCPHGNRRRPYFWYIPPEIIPTIRETAQHIEQHYDTDTDYDKALAVQTFLLDEDNFRYTYSLPEFGAKDPIVAFLTTTKVGSCEQFSTAMALLLRAWRIPTRLVIGYKGGEYDAGTNSFVFRDKHAHAWVEVYFNSLGWVEFDPTPGAETVTEQRQGLLGAFSRAAQRVRSVVVRSYRDTRALWGGRVLGYSRTQQRRLMEGLSQAAGSLTQQTSRVLRRLWPGMPDIGALEVALLVVGMTFTGLGIYLSARWLQGRVAWLRPGAEYEKTLDFYRDLLRILRRKGLERPPQLTPREFAFVASTALAASNDDGHELSSALRAVTDMYYRVRFGRHEPSRGEMEAVRAALQRVSRATRVRRRAASGPGAE